jgi:hypothetical protein
MSASASKPTPAAATDATACLNQRPTEHPVCLGEPLHLTDEDQTAAGVRLVGIMMITLGLGMLACLAFLVAIAIGATPW